MLDRPRTFDVAETLVNEFGELNDAHQAVVTAREQVQTLTPARKEHLLCSFEPVVASLLRSAELSTSKLLLTGTVFRIPQ
ncbi:MAG: hypothetical protein GWP08_13585 [Nitrospiraceae bacterium]|nr:hypothetical protein [Nitrospiraceae bacterium]